MWVRILSPPAEKLFLKSATAPVWQIPRAQSQGRRRRERAQGEGRRQRVRAPFEGRRQRRELRARAGGREGELRARAATERESSGRGPVAEGESPGRGPAAEGGSSGRGPAAEGESPGRGPAADRSRLVHLQFDSFSKRFKVHRTPTTQYDFSAQRVDDICSSVVIVIHVLTIAALHHNMFIHTRAFPFVGC